MKLYIAISTKGEYFNRKASLYLWMNSTFIIVNFCCVNIFLQLREKIIQYYVHIKVHWKVCILESNIFFISPGAGICSLFVAVENLFVGHKHWSAQFGGPWALKGLCMIVCSWAFWNSPMRRFPVLSSSETENILRLRWAHTKCFPNLKIALLMGILRTEAGVNICQMPTYIPSTQNPNICPCYKSFRWVHH